MNDDDLRRLLREARHDAPVPDDVAARLDRVLAGLGDEAPNESARAVDLDARRRRRRVSTLLVAAAAVVAVGLGLGQLDLSRSSNDSAGSESASSGGSVAADEDTSAPAPSDADRAQKDRPTADVEVAREPVEVSESDFPVVAEKQALTRTTGSRDESSALDGAETAAGAAEAGWFDCRRGAFGPGRLVAVDYQGSSAVLAVRPPTGDSVVVELLQCGTATVLRSATVPLP